MLWYCGWWAILRTDGWAQVDVQSGVIEIPLHDLPWDDQQFQHDRAGEQSVARAMCMCNVSIDMVVYRRARAVSSVCAACDITFRPGEEVSVGVRVGVGPEAVSAVSEASAVVSEACVRYEVAGKCWEDGVIAEAPPGLQQCVRAL